jgi:hypothetical protein
MSLDIDSEVHKAGVVMSRYGMTKEDQLEVLRLLVAVGVEHCLNEQERVRTRDDATVAKAFSGLVH